MRLRGWAGCERFVVLGILINSVSLVGRALINPWTLLIDGEEPVAQACLRVKTKIKEYHHLHRKDILG